jgi:hypothetical protein
MRSAGYALAGRILALSSAPDDKTSNREKPPSGAPAMKHIIIRAAVLAATLAACGHTAPAAAPVATPAASATLTCKQQADAWKTTNASALKAFQAALTPFATGTVTSAQAAALAATAQAAENMPPPACADPKGYYGQALAQLVTAGDAAGGGGALSELGALTPMESALADLSQLEAELTRTIGSGQV